MGVISAAFALVPEDADDHSKIEEQAKVFLKGNSDKYSGYKIVKRSLDARGKQIKFRFKLDVYTLPDKPESVTIVSGSHRIEMPQISFPKINPKKEVYIIGFGPAGMFAALELLRNGFKPIVLERGKEVKDRRRDLADINKKGLINPESNYCFGEGGAGTFSDGKLYTRSHKRGDVQEILGCFVRHGANPNILYEAHPHIGTNKLPAIIESMRKTIIDNGGEIQFETKLEEIMVEKGKVVGLRISKGNFKAKQVILATGHSARDIFTMLQKSGIATESKPFALGVRIEHPQSFIDKVQYRKSDRGDYLPPASYSLVQQVDGRGVFSFCMCPGGIIAPAATDFNEIVVNGWSPSKRNGPFANSGLVVTVDESDWNYYNDLGPLAAMHFQAEVEQKAFEAGGGNLKAPAQKALDFVNKKVSTSLPETSYIPGVVSADLFDILPDTVSSRLQKALKMFDQKIKGYLHPEAVLVGVESRTSSPVRIPRNAETLQHPDVQGLYPCGEGAGFAGGIVSAALDGVKCAEAIINDQWLINVV